MRQTFAIGFTGTQHGMTAPQAARVLELLTQTKPVEFHHGDCIGADAEAVELADELGGVWVVKHPPLDTSKQAHTRSDEEYEPKPYLVRNHDIVNVSQLLVACPRTFKEEQRSGTWATIRFAAQTGKKTAIIWPDGRVEARP